MINFKKWGLRILLVLLYFIGLYMVLNQLLEVLYLFEELPRETYFIIGTITGYLFIDCIIALLLFFIHRKINKL